MSRSPHSLCEPILSNSRKENRNWARLKPLSRCKVQLKTENSKGSRRSPEAVISLRVSGSVLEHVKVKQQQQEIDITKYENQNLRQEITGLNQTINQERREKNEKKLRKEIEEEHTKITDKLRDELKKIHDFFPHIRIYSRWEGSLRGMDLKTTYSKRLFNRERLTVRAGLHPRGTARNFDAEDATHKLEQDPDEPSKSALTINGTDIF